MSYRCARCCEYKEENAFGLDKNDNRRKTCERCYQGVLQFYQNQRNQHPVITDDNWKQALPIEYPDLWCSKLGLVYNNRTGRVIGSVMKDGYLMVNINKKGHRVHHLIYETFIGPIPVGMVIDHINHVTCDNRLENLRIVTQQANCTGDHRLGLNRIKKPVTLRNLITGEERSFPSMNQASIALRCQSYSVKCVVDGVTNSVISKIDGSKWGLRPTPSVLRGGS